jgi:hypothetical protein
MRLRMAMRCAFQYQDLRVVLSNAVLPALRLFDKLRAGKLRTNGSRMLNFLIRISFLRSASAKTRYKRKIKYGCGSPHYGIRPKG